MPVETVPITAEMMIEDVLDRYPDTALIFVRQRMQCVGCPMARFESLEEACAIYHIDAGRFVAELNAIAQGNRSASEPRPI